jgi:putative aldouronate transport system substrate-binding protein
MKKLKCTLFLFVILVVAACGGKKPTPVETTSGGIDTSKEVHLVGYLLGADEHVGLKKVIDTINAKMKNDINATIEIRFIGWGDMASKYRLVLASGDLDWIYTGAGAYYTQEAQRRAFMEITEDMVRTYMPRHYAVLDPEAYKQVQVNIDGEKKMFMVCKTSPNRAVQAFLLRKDLREKYDVIPVSRFSDIEPYLEAIKKNEPGMIPLMLNNSYDIKRPFTDLLREVGIEGIDMYSATGAGLNIMYDWRDKSGKVFTYFDEPYRSAAIQICKKVKEWFDKGYINSDVFGNIAMSKDSFAQGKSGVALGHSRDLPVNIAAAVANGWDPEIIATLSPDRKYPLNAYSGEGVALAASCKNPERALMALDLLMDEYSYKMLDVFGIEGENYIITPDGKVGTPSGITADTNTYPISPFWFVYKDDLPLWDTWTDNYIAHRNELDSILVNNSFAAFTPDREPTKTEEANCNNVFMQYGQPLFAGAVKDVDASFAELERMAKAAGYDKIVEEAKRQFAEYVKTFQ